MHSYVCDLLGRKSNDCNTTVSTGIDTTVLQIATAYEVRGMVSGITSYDSATPGSGDVVNDVQLVYNCFAQLASDCQSHSGAVDMGTTPVVQYGYADGSANTIRPITMTYPNGRVLNYDYGCTGGMNDALSRIGSLIDNDGMTHLADYSYLGLSNFVEVNETQPGVTYTLLGLVPGNDPVTGDMYQGLDQFSRIKDLIWTSTGGGSSSSSSSSSSGAATVVERIQHGYDLAGNRLWRKELADLSETHDELYSYDGIYRLTNLQRGTLNAGETAISSETFAQCWGLDATGNWQTFQQDDTGDGLWDIVQGRASNTVNEITAVTNSVGSSWATPAYDGAGNMTTIPQSASPGSSFVGTYDAWNRLMSLYSAGNQVAGYRYDGRNWRTIKNLYADGVLNSTRHYFYSSAWQSLEERLGTTTTPDRQFIWGLRYIDDIVLRDRDPNAIGTLTERFYGIQDPNWNVTGLLDGTGAVRERYKYDAYGNPTVLTQAFVVQGISFWDWETMYAGYRSDLESGLHAVRNRFFAPRLGIWLRRDALGFIDGLDLYAYEKNDPVDFVDPLGAAATLAQCNAAVAAVVGSPWYKALLPATKGCQLPKPICVSNMQQPKCGEGSGFTNSQGITICYDNNDANQLAFSIRHELIHAADNCGGYSKNWNNACANLACPEILAYMFSGDCTADRKQGGLRNAGESVENCVLRAAAGSIHNECGMIAPETAVCCVWQKCLSPLPGAKHGCLRFGPNKRLGLPSNCDKGDLKFCGQVRNPV